MLLLLSCLRANDKHERQINYRALTFAFVGTLAFAVTIGFLQSFGFHPVFWLGIPRYAYCERKKNDRKLSLPRRSGRSPDYQRHRNRQVRSEPPARFQDRPRLWQDRGRGFCIRRTNNQRRRIPPSSQVNQIA